MIEFGITYFVFGRYVDDDEGIKKYFAAFHLQDKYPVAVVVDDFGDFFDEGYVFNILIKQFQFESYCKFKPNLVCYWEDF